jgi:hypothetical protein
MQGALHFAPDAGLASSGIVSNFEANCFDSYRVLTA